MKKERITLQPDVHERVLIKDGKKFRLVKEVVGKDHHVKKIIFEEYDEKDWNKRVNKLVTYLANKSKLSTKDILKSVINSVTYKELGKLEKEMKNKSKVKIQKGCIGLKMGKAEIFISD